MSFFRPRDEWVVVLLGALMLLIGTNTQTGWLYVVVAVLAALLCVGFIGPRLTVRGLEVVRLAHPPAVEGETVTVRLRVRNPSPWPRYLVSVEEPAPFAPPDEKPHRFVIGQVPAQGGVTVEYPVPCRRRGVQPLGPVRIGSGTPVGFFPVARVVAPKGDGATVPELIVYPRGPLLNRVDLLSVAPRSASSSETFQRVGHSYDFQGIREYQIGDDLRLVHWPTSARSGRLMLRQFREQGAQHTVLLIDNGSASAEGAPGETALDDATRLGASLVAAASRGSTHISLVAADDDGAPAILHNARGVQALDWLARLQGVGGMDGRWVELLARTAPHLDRSAQVVVATPVVPDAAEQIRLMELGLRLIVVLFAGYRVPSEEGLAAASGASLPAGGAADAPALHDAVRTLRERGIRVRVQTRGQGLEAVFSGGGGMA